MHQTARQPGQHVSARHQHTRTSRSVPVPKCAAAKDTQPVVLVPLASQTVAETSERVRAHIVALQQSTDWHALQACLQRAAALHQAACSRTQAAQAPAASPSVPPRPQQQTVDSFRARMAAARTKTQVANAQNPSSSTPTNTPSRPSSTQQPGPSSQPSHNATDSITQDTPWQWSDVTRLVVLGLGSIEEASGSEASTSTSQPPLTPSHTHSTRQRTPTKRLDYRQKQLALALSLQQVLPGLREPPFFADPALTHFDTQLISNLHGSVISHTHIDSYLDPAQPAPTSDASNDPAAAAADTASWAPAAVSQLQPAVIATAAAASKQSASSEQVPPAATAGTPATPAAPATPATAAAVSKAAAGRVLLYMPCCPRWLYGSVLQCACERGVLGRVAILGTSFRTMVDSTALLQSLTYEDPSDADLSTPDIIKRVTTSPGYVEVPAPDCGAHGVAISLHMFTSQSLKT